MWKNKVTKLKPLFTDRQERQTHKIKHAQNFCSHTIKIIGKGVRAMVF